MPDVGERSGAPFLDWAVAGRPADGETACGDVAATLVLGGRYVLAVIDGLGHGPEAAHSATLAAAVVKENGGLGPAELLDLVHRRLAGTRGAAATVAVVDALAGRLDWLGVGNVNGVVARAGAARPPTYGVFLGGGVLGAQMPTLPRPKPIRLAPGDCIVIATDGVRADLAEAARSPLRADGLARRILEDHGVPTDDALVLVARYLGRRRDAAGRDAAGGAP